MFLYHASKAIVSILEIRKTKFTKDFSWGFYCTKNKEQAIRWANRGIGEPVINIFGYEPNKQLKILTFDKMCEKWLDFIADCRAGKTHTFDIVEGPMADDTVWNYVNDFIQGNITREQFWVLAQFKHPTHQISFHSSQALQCLKFISSEIIYDK